MENKNNKKNIVKILLIISSVIILIIPLLLYFLKILTGMGLGISYFLIIFVVATVGIAIFMKKFKKDEIEDENIDEKVKFLAVNKFMEKGCQPENITINTEHAGRKADEIKVVTCIDYYDKTKFAFLCLTKDLRKNRTLENYKEKDIIDAADILSLSPTPPIKERITHRTMPLTGSEEVITEPITEEEKEEKKEEGKI